MTGIASSSHGNDEPSSSGVVGVAGARREGGRAGVRVGGRVGRGRIVVGGENTVVGVGGSVTAPGSGVPSVGHRLVLRSGDAGVVLGAGDAALRRRLEGDPADAVEPDLRPGVRVAPEHAVPAVGAQPARGVADGDAGRDAERARHHRKRGCELLAVALADLQEVLDRVVPVAGLDLGAVLEVVAEPVLEGDQPVVVGRGAGGDRGGGVVHVVGHVVGQAEEDLVGRVVGGRRAQFVGREVGRNGHDRELLARHQVASA